MKRQSFVLVPTFVLLMLMFARSSAFSQGNNADVQGGSAGGHADVPAMEGPGLARSRLATQAVSEDTLRFHSRGFTQTGVAAKQGLETGKVESTSKAIVVAGTGRDGSTSPEAAAAPEPRAPSLGITFQGATDTGEFPPDPTIATGPSDVVVAVNGRVNIFDKTGALRPSGSQSLTNFFSMLGPPAFDGPFDPWLVFDPYINRFWLIAASCTTNAAGDCISSGAGRRSTILVALSNGSDEAAGWRFFALDARLNGNRSTGFWCDYPKIGIDAQAVYFTCNMFSSGSSGDFQYAKIRVMTKDQFINNTCCRWWDRWDLREGFLNLSKSFSIQPALMHGATVAHGMFLVNAVGGGSGGDELKIWRVRNAQRCCIPGNQSAPDFQVKSQTVGSYSVPHDAPQFGTNVKIDTGDARLLYAFWKDELLSTGQGTTCKSVACFAFTELSVGGYPTVRVVNDFAGAGDGLYRYYPHVAVNAEGNKTMVYSSSNNAQFVDVRFVGIPPSSICRNCIDGPEAILQPGLASYVKRDADKKNRWGDYSGASADPDGVGIWVHGEFAGGNPMKPQANTWGTRVALTRESGAKIAADLMPVPISTPPGGFCNFSKGSLIVTVKNGGNADASPSFTQVDFDDGSSFSLPTPDIAANDSVDLAPLVIPSTCFMPDCSFRITVDSTNLIDELDESNNTANGQCAG